MSDKKGLGDKVKGTVSNAKGEAKDQIGNATNNQDMQAEGKKDKLKGKMQNEVGEAKNDHENRHNRNH